MKFEIAKIITSIFSKRWILILILVFLSVVPYANSINNEFAYDDVDYFVSWEEVKNVDIALFFQGSQPLNFHHVYRPIRTVLHSILWQFFGSNPTPYHIFAITIHAFIVLLLFYITKKLTNKKIAFFSSAVFATLPVHVESISFIIGSLNTFGILLMLLSYYFYLKIKLGRVDKNFYISIILALLAFFTYELTIILPLLIILTDICFRIKSESKNKLINNFRKYYVWYLLGVASLLVVRFEVLKTIYTSDLLIHIDLVSRVLTMSKAFIKYLYLAIFNFPLSLYHPVEIIYFPDLKVLFSVLAIIALAGLAFYYFNHRKKIITFIIGWFIISLLPVSNLIQIASFVNENYLYLASFAWALLFGYIVFKIYQYSLKSNKKYIQKLIVSLFIIIISFYGFITWQRNYDWRNEETLWLATLDRYPNYLKAHNNLAFYYSNEGKFEKAKDSLATAIKLDPNYSYSYSGLGEVAKAEGDLNSAIKYFSKAISLNSANVGNYNSLGVVYVYADENELAIKNFQSALEIYPSMFESNFNLASVYIGQKNYQEALVHFLNSSKVRPNDIEAIFGVGLSYFNLNDISNAEKYFSLALKIDADYNPALEFIEKIRVDK